MAARVDKSSNKSRRVLDLLIRIVESKCWLPLEDFDRETWGDERTLRRALNEINGFWTEKFGRKLFDVVDADGIPTLKGDRFIRLADSRFSLETARAESLAVYPAVIAYLNSLKGSIIGAQLETHFSRMRDTLLNRQKTRLNNMSKKFVFAGKGVVDYGIAERSSHLDEIYDALLKEQLLSATIIKPNAPSKEAVLKPLALVFHNNALYLIALFEAQTDDETPYRFRIDTLIETKSLSGKKFTYPRSFDPQKEFDGVFGIFSSRDARKKKFDVELQFVNDPYVKRYVRERRYTNTDLFSDNSDGTLTLKMQLMDLNEISTWVMSFGRNAIVVGPTELREKVAAELETAAAIYRKLA